MPVVATSRELSVVSYVLVCLSIYVCLHSERNLFPATNTKFGTNILHDSRSECIYPDVKRLKVEFIGLSSTLPARSSGLLKFSSETIQVRYRCV